MLVDISESFFVKELGSYLRSWQTQSNYQNIMTKKKTKHDSNEWQHLLVIHLILYLLKISVFFVALLSFWYRK